MFFNFQIKCKWFCITQIAIILNSKLSSALLKDSRNKSIFSIKIFSRLLVTIVKIRSYILVDTFVCNLTWIYYIIILLIWLWRWEPLTLFPPYGWRSYWTIIVQHNNNISKFLSCSIKTLNTTYNYDLFILLLIFINLD